MTELRQDVRQSRQNSTLPNSPQSVSTKRIKTFVSSHFSSDHPLRQVILAEKEKLTPEEALAKMEVWLVLLNHKS
jgi:hypothetical protein